MYWKMGWRNIWRNKRRSAITIGAMAFSVALLVFFFGFMASWTDQMEENIIGLSLGDMQIHHPLYLSDQNLYQVVPEADALVQELHAAGFGAALRSYGYGLLASDHTGKSAGVQMKGISLVDEPGVTNLHLEKNLAEGRYLSGKTRSYEPPVEETGQDTDLFVDPLAAFADPLDESDTDGAQELLIVGEIVLGRKLAHTLGVHPGDQVNVVTMAADGTMGNELFDVVGVFKNFSEMEDRSLGLIAQDDFQRLFRLPAGQVHEISLRMPSDSILTEKAAVVANLTGDRGEVKTWREILPAIAQMIDFTRSVMVVFGFIMYIGAGLLIMNSTLMMVFERIHEFGVMKAIGLRPQQILALVLFETFWMSLAAGIAGIAAGAPLTLWIGKVGIDLTSVAPDGLSVSGTVMDPVMYARLTTESIYIPFAMLFLIAFASALYPAVKAAVIEPVKAIYHV
jgi:ABC-type lipoprotein release transport system permease subunit